MIVRLPYPDLLKCTNCFSDMVVINQLSTIKSILSIIKNPNNKLYNHPSILMWVGYTRFLKNFYNHLISELNSRDIINSYIPYEISGKVKIPYFMGNEEFHKAHKAGLIRLRVSYLEKAIKYQKRNYNEISKKFYRNYIHLVEHGRWPDINPEIKYYWPTKII